jgi:hypothetical protein
LEKLNSRQRKVLQAIFEHPPRSDLEWKAVETLLLALGAILPEGRGSRVRVLLNDRPAVIHRPHPQRVIDKGSVKSVQKFLVRAGINPNT